MAAVLSEHDQKYLNADQQKQVLALKEQYAAATDPNVKADLNKQAENIRASAGYTGGKDGSGYTQTPQVNTSLGGQSAQDTEQWLKNYKYDNLNASKGWVNGYGVAPNVRSMSNYIRQQMDKNTQDWHVADADTKKYLHDQNVELEKLLQKYAGGVESTYDPVTGRWSTKNPDLGYGWDSGMGTLKDYERYGITEDLYNQYKYDTSHYYNMTDRRNVPNPVADADGFSGRYAAYELGPFQNYINHGTRGWNEDYMWNQDAVGDGFMDEYSLTPHMDAEGNVIFVDDYLKYNNGVSDYTNQFTPKIVNGIIQPSGLGSGRGGWVEGESRPVSGNMAAQEGYVPYAQRNGSGSGSGNGGYSDMLEQMYGEALKAQLAQLESSYKQNVSDLDASSVKADANYNEQKRQTDGTSAQNAANWREMANAYGLNSGTIGQAALAQNNQRQSDLNTLGAAQAQAQAEIERQRTLLGQQYQLQINQAIAENNQQKAQALYQEAVRMDEVLRQEQQNNANLMLQYAQMAMQQQQYNSDLALQYAKMAGSSSKGGGGGPSSEQVIMPDYEGFYQFAEGTGNPYSTLTQKEYAKMFDIYNVGDELTEGYNNWQKQQGQAAYNRQQAAMSNALELRSVFGNNGTKIAEEMARHNFSTDEIGTALDRLGIK